MCSSAAPPRRRIYIGLGLQSEAAGGVRNLDTKRLRALKDQDTLASRHVVRDLGSVCFGLQKQQLELSKIGDNEHLVARGDQVPGLLVRAVADFRHADGAAEPAAHDGVDTLGLAPFVTDALVTIGVVTLELLAVLLNNLRVRK